MLDMKYKILYLEDLKAESMVSDFRDRDIELDVNHVDSYEDAMKTLSKPGYDAYLMDYRLSQGGGYLDAPAFAAFLRTENKKGVSLQTPIFMITNEKGLHILRKDNENKQDLFDMTLLKDDYRNHKDWIINSMVAYIEAYRNITFCKFAVEKVLKLSKSEIKEYIDSRLLKELNQAKMDKDIYRYLKLIAQYLLGSPCVLVNTQDVAARLGVDIDKSVEEFNVFLKELDDCRYRGVLGEVADRWWHPRVMNKWNEISPDQPLRMTEARQRVEILNKEYKTSLKSAEPIKECESTCYWTTCVALKRPLDPAEGFVCNYRYKMPWEENEYISLVGALEYPDFQKLLSESDKREIRSYGKGK
jgi:hypothetical protein